MDLRFRFRGCFPARFSPEMTLLPLSFSSYSRRFPMSSVSFLDLRPPLTPPPEPPPPPLEPLPPPTPPKPPDPPDAQICLFSGETLLKPPISTSFRAFDSLLQLASGRSDFSSPASLPLPATKLLLSIVLPQVCSLSSPSNSSKMGMYWMFVEFVALVLWISDLGHPVSRSFDTLMSLCMLSCSALIALMRSFTAVCRFCLNLALLEVVSWQLAQRSLSTHHNQLVNLVQWGCHSPHLSFTELIIFPHTSLVFSGSVTGNIVFKTVLLEADARIVIQDCLRSALADCLMLTTQEALFPPPCGFGKDFQAKDVCFIGCSCLDAISVELKRRDERFCSEVAKRIYAFNNGTRHCRRQVSPPANTQKKLPVGQNWTCRSGQLLK